MTRRAAGTVPAAVLDLAVDGIPDDDPDARAAARSGAVYGWNLAHTHPVKASTNRPKTQALARDLRQRAELAAAGDVRRLEHRRAQAAGQAVGLTAGLRHAEACQRCGRGLKDPVSVRRGVGPDCWANGYRPEDLDDDAELDDLDEGLDVR